MSSELSKSHRLSVLMIDKEQSDAYLVRLLLKNAEGLTLSFQHETCLHAGLSSLMNHSVDLVIVDPNQGEQNSRETIERLMETVPHVPIVVLTEEDDFQVAFSYLQLGVQDYLIKGEFEKSTLIRVLHYALERQKILRQHHHRQNSLKEQLDQQHHFISKFSHDLRHPVNAIQSQLNALDEQLQTLLSDDQKKAINTIQSDLHRIAELTQNSEDLNNIDRGDIPIRKELFELIPFVDELLNSIKSTHVTEHQKLNLVVQNPTHSQQAFADKDKLGYIFMHLIQNALKAIPKMDGKVDLIISERNYRDARQLHFCLSDNGPGFTEAILDFINNNVQNKRPQGMGLSIVKQFLTLHGGHISAKNTDRGADLSFTLPIPRENPVVLLVENNPAIASIIESFLKHKNVKTMTASTGAEAILLIEQTLPDLIFMDMELPDYSGYKILHNLKKKQFTDTIPVVSFSGDVIEDARGQGIAFLPKPFGAPQLQRCLNTYLPQPSSFQRV